jgi:hypothetical protein
MKIGDIVRLKKPFKPVIGNTQEYFFAVIAGLVRHNSSEVEESDILEIIVYLYDPKSSQIYIDEFGTEAMYSIHPNEIEAIME